MKEQIGGASSANEVDLKVCSRIVWRLPAAEDDPSLRAGLALDVLPFLGACHPNYIIIRDIRWRQNQELLGISSSRTEEVNGHRFPHTPEIDAEHREAGNRIPGVRKHGNVSEV